MKKFYALAAVAMMATTAMAQNGAPLYATGAGDFEGGSWAPATASEFTYADGKYQLNVTNLTQFKVSTVIGEWEVFNAGALTCEYGDTPGVAVPLVAGDVNIEAPWKGDYTITVAGDLSTITLTTDTPEPPKAAPEIYFRGDMNSWGADEAWKLTCTDLDKMIFSFTCADDQAIAAGETFKIADADWNKYNIGGADEEPLFVSEGEDVLENPLVSGSNPANLQLEAEWNGIAWLIQNAAHEWTIVFSNNKDLECPWGGEQGGVQGVSVDNGEAVYYNMQGVRVNAPESGLYIVVKDGKAVKVIK